MPNLDGLFRKYGWLEVLVRRLSYAMPQSIRAKVKSLSKRPCASVEPTVSKEELFNDVRRYDIKPGDLLIVHSSMDALCHQEANAKEILEFLLDLVGENGTLALPAYPDISFVSDDGRGDEEIPIYNPKRTLCWTGMLPNLFLRYPGTVRSAFPYNPLAANGYLAEAMMEGNLKGDLPHGENSAWKYCVDHDAKILFLGVDPHNCNTVAHVAEDSMDEDWPIDRWYKRSVCRIKLPDGIVRFSFRERRLFWARFIQEHYACAKYEELGYLERHTIRGVIPLGFIRSSKEFVDYLIREAANGNTPLYRIPRRHYKHKKAYS